MCGHQSSEERKSISPILLTVVVTVILVVLYWLVRFLIQVTIALEGRDCQSNY